MKNGNDVAPTKKHKKDTCLRKEETSAACFMSKGLKKRLRPPFAGTVEQRIRSDLFEGIATWEDSFGRQGKGLQNGSAFSRPQLDKNVTCSGPATDAFLNLNLNSPDL